MTIRHKKTGKLQEVTAAQFEEIRARSRGWEKISESTAERQKKVLVSAPLKTPVPLETGEAKSRI